MKMTNEEIKEVLDAFDLGKQIEEYGEQEKYWFNYLGEKEIMLRLITRGVIYRIKPEPRKLMYYGGVGGFNDFNNGKATHIISYLVEENGEPICDSVKLEKL